MRRVVDEVAAADATEGVVAPELWVALRDAVEQRVHRDAAQPLVGDDLVALGAVQQRALDALMQAVAR